METIYNNNENKTEYPQILSQFTHHNQQINKENIELKMRER